MSSTNYAISIIVILILGLIMKEDAIQYSIKIILCTIVGLVAYSVLNRYDSTENFAVPQKRLTRDDVNMLIDLKLSAFSSATTKNKGMTFDQVNNLIRNKMESISASPSMSSMSSSSLTSGQLDNLAKLSALSQLKDPELNTLVQLAKYPPVSLTSKQTATLTTLDALSGLTSDQTSILKKLSEMKTEQITSLTSLSGLTLAQITALTGLIAPPVQVAGVASTAVQLPDNMPSGTIVIWANALTTGVNRGIPRGWALCDGGNGTPDLRARFVMGINEVEIEEKKEDDIIIHNKRSKMAWNYDGGMENITLTKENIPSHQHFGAKIGNYGAIRPSTDDGMNTLNTASHCDTCGNRQDDGGTYTGFWGGDKDRKTKKFSILPNYKVLCYIMKL